MESKFYLYNTVQKSYIVEENGDIVYFTSEDDAKIFLRNPFLWPWKDMDEVVITSDLDPLFLDYSQVEAREWLKSEYRFFAQGANAVYDTLIEMGEVM